MNYKIEEKHNAYGRRQVIIKFGSQIKLQAVDVEIDEGNKKLKLIYGIMVYGEIPLETQIASDILKVWHEDNSTAYIARH